MVDSLPQPTSTHTHTHTHTDTQVVAAATPHTNKSTLVIRRAFSELLLEHGLAAEIVRELEKIISGGSRTRFFTYLRQFASPKGARQVTTAVLSVETLSEQILDTLRGLLPKLERENPEVYQAFKTDPVLKQIFKQVQKKYSQPSAARQLAYRKAIKEY